MDTSIDEETERMKNEETERIAEVLKYCTEAVQPSKKDGGKYKLLCATVLTRSIIQLPTQLYLITLWFTEIASYQLYHLIIATAVVPSVEDIKKKVMGEQLAIVRS